MKYITILCFERGEIHIFPFYKDYEGKDFEYIAEDIHDSYDIKFSEGSCQWMIGNLNLKIHERIS